VVSRDEVHLTYGLNIGSVTGQDNDSNGYHLLEPSFIAGHRFI
jgi:hypothetical protein